MMGEFFIFMGICLGVGLGAICLLWWPMITINSKKKLTKSSRTNTLLVYCVSVSICPVVLIFMLIGQPSNLVGVLIGWALILFAVYIVSGPPKWRKQERTFYNNCKTYYAITSRKDAERSVKIQERLKIQAEKDKIPVSCMEDIYTILDKATQFETENKQEKDQAKAALVRKLGLAEQKELALLTRYAGLHGREKPLAMLKDREKDFRKLEARRGMPLKKESDGMILAGMASGIGGVVPAVASLSQTAKNNEAVREYNRGAMAYNALIAGSPATSDKYSSAQEMVKGKLVADLPGKELMKHLAFHETHVLVTETGTVWVSTQVAFDDRLIIFDDVPAYIDGTVIAEIYDGKQKIGEATMVFPLPGSGGSSEGKDIMNRRCFPGTAEPADYGRWPTVWENLTGQDTKRPVVSISAKNLTPSVCRQNTVLAGMCLSCGQEGKKYNVKFVPGNLWAMEK